MTEIKLFNEWLETSELSTSGIALWYALMYIANRSGWKPQLCIPLSAIMLRTKMSRSTIYRERGSLYRHGLIDFDVGDGRQSSNYRIIGFEERLVSHVASPTETQTETQPKEPSQVVFHTATQGETQTDFVSHTETQHGTIYKLNNISLDKKIDRADFKERQDQKKKSCAKKESFDLSFVGDPVWEEMLRTWLEYKQGRNQSYKSDLLVKKFLTMLRNLSRGDPQTAQKIIDKSIANNWAGVFELTEAGSQPRGQPATGQRIGQIKQPEDEARRQQLLEKFDSKNKPK